MEKGTANEDNKQIQSNTKTTYEKPEMKEHEPLEESAAYVYYYYVF